MDNLTAPDPYNQGVCPMSYTRISPVPISVRLVSIPIPTVIQAHSGRLTPAATSGLRLMRRWQPRPLPATAMSSRTPQNSKRHRTPIGMDPGIWPLRIRVVASPRQITRIDPMRMRTLTVRGGGLESTA